MPIINPSEDGPAQARKQRSSMPPPEGASADDAQRTEDGAPCEAPCAEETYAMEREAQLQSHLRQPLCRSKEEVRQKLKEQ